MAIDNSEISSSSPLSRSPRSFSRLRAEAEAAKNMLWAAGKVAQNPLFFFQMIIIFPTKSSALKNTGKTLSHPLVDHHFP